MATFRKRRSRKYRNKNTRRKSLNTRKYHIKRRGKKTLRGGIFGLLFSSSKAPDKVSKTWWKDEGKDDGVIIDAAEYGVKTVSEANLEAQRLTMANEKKLQEEKLKRKQEEAERVAKEQRESEIQLIMNRRNKIREEATNIYEERVKLLQANLEADKKKWARNPSKYEWMNDPDTGFK